MSEGVVRRRGGRVSRLTLSMAATLLFLAACGKEEGASAAGAADAPGSTGTASSEAASAAGASAAPAGVASPGEQARRDWTKAVAATPDGGVRVGNPEAPVKLIEFASFTCPHCAEFEAEAHGPLMSDFVAKGTVSYELRNFVMNGPDLAATLLARCQGPSTFFRMAQDFFRAQPEWLERLQSAPEPERVRVESLPPDRQTIAIAELAGFDDFMRARGVGRARFEQCLTDKDEVAKLSNIRQQAVERYELRGTPHFVLNGEPLPDVASWAKLEPRLQAAAR